MVTRMADDNDDDGDALEELRHSFEVYGPIRPVIRTKFGVASGETRKKAVPEWPELSQEKVETYLDHLKLKVADNLQRDKSTAWWAEVINDAAKEYEKMGTPNGEISRKLI